jgi:D-threo-aldose 1-dehydrogenase
LQVTRLGLGTAPLGGLFEAVTEDEAHRAVEAAWHAGIRFFDTAPLYGFGLAEARLGAVLRTKPRDEFVLSTKVGRLLREGAPAEPGQAWQGTPPLNPVFDFSYDAVMRSVEESLSRLGMDHVDMLLIHDPDQHYDHALSGAYRALDRLRAEGVIKAVGAGMNQWEMLARFAREADMDCLLLAGRYTLLDRSGASELLPLCLQRGIAVIAGGVFNSGILADPGPGTHYNYEPAPAHLIERAQQLKATCERHGIDIKAAALQFPLRHPAVAAVLSGPRSVGELEENVRLFQTPIPDVLWDELER